MKFVKKQAKVEAFAKFEAFQLSNDKTQTVKGGTNNANNNQQGGGGGGYSDIIIQ